MAISQMSGSLDDGHHEVWSHPVVWIVGVRWPGYVGPAGGDQRVIWRSGVSPDVCPGIDRTGKFKKF